MLTAWLQKLYLAKSCEALLICLHILNAVKAVSVRDENVGPAKQQRLTQLMYLQSDSMSSLYDCTACVFKFVLGMGETLPQLSYAASESLDKHDTWAT